MNNYYRFICRRTLFPVLILITIWSPAAVTLDNYHDLDYISSDEKNMNSDLTGPPFPHDQSDSVVIRIMEEGQGPLNAVTIQYRNDTGRRYEKHVVVDASDDGGIWWYPQGSGFRFDANERHQGKHLADWMRAKGWKVTEIGRHGRVGYALLEGADLVIRAGASFDNQQYGTSDGRILRDDTMYDDSELESYQQYVVQGGLVLLLGQENDIPGGMDPLVKALGYAGVNSWSYGNGYVVLEDQFLLDIIIDVAQPRTDLLFEQMWQRRKSSVYPEQEETSLSAPELLFPKNGATLPQGGAIWKFTWSQEESSDIKGWHILVYRRGAAAPLIKRFTSNSSYTYNTGGGMFIQPNCSHWRWKVRAVRSDGKTGSWSKLRHFQITPPDVYTQKSELEALNQQVKDLYIQGQYEKAVEVAREALAATEKTYGPDHPDVVKSLKNLAIIYESQGKYSAAAQLYQRALKILEKSLGSDHPYVALILNDLATLYKNQWKYDKAEPLFQRALEILEKSWGPDHVRVARSLSGLGDCYCDRGQYEKAEPVLQRALVIREKALGPDHPDVSQSLNNLAVLFHSQGKYDKAEPLLQRALAIQEKDLGDNHPVVATSISNLAMLYSDQGKYEEAESLSRRALTIREKSLGPDHPDVAASLNKLASLYDTKGKYEEAESLYRRALTISEKALGPDHHDVAVFLNNLAVFYKKQEEYDKVEPLYRRALGIKENILGSNHLDVAAMLNNMAGFYASQGKYSEAEPLYQRAQAIRDSILDQTHPDMAASLNNLAGFFYDQGKYSEAEPLLQRALVINEELFGQEHLYVANSLNNLAVLYSNQGKYKEAESHHQRALVIQEKILGKNHPEVATSMSNLALLCIEQGKHDNAEPLLQQALAIKEKALGPDHSAVSICLNNLAGLYDDQEKYHKAEPLYRRALEINKKTFGQDHPYVATIMDNLAFIYHSKGESNEAESLLQQALIIREKVLGKNHFDVAASLNSLGIFYHSQEKFELSIDYYRRGMSVLEKASRTAGGEEYAGGFRKDQKVVCSGLLNAMYQLHTAMPQKAEIYLGDTFKATEISRSRRFLDELSKASASKFAGLSKEDSEREKVIALRIRNMRDAKKQELMKPLAEQNQLLITNLDKQIWDSKAERRKMYEEFEKKYPRYIALKYPEPIDVNEVQKKLLQPGEMILSYWLGYKHLYVCRIEKENFKFIAHPVDKNKLKIKIKSFCSGIQQKLGVSMFKKLATSLYNEIMTPFLGDINLSDVRLLYIIPHGALNTIPFEALLTKELKYLFLEVPICYVPSAMVLRAIRNDMSLQSHDDTTREPVLLFGDPVYTEEQLDEKSKDPYSKNVLALNSRAKGTAQVLVGMDRSVANTATRALRVGLDGNVFLSPLPGTLREVKFISDLFYQSMGGKDVAPCGPCPHLYTGCAAKESQIKFLSDDKSLEKYKFVHLAAHGILPREVKGLAEPCIVLSLFGDESEDGFLKMSEIFGLEMNADLVTLSACQTALEDDITEGQGISGLARAFFYAGTPRLTVSLWSISDVGTCEFMKRYYYFLREREKDISTMSTLEALNKARKSMLKSEYSHPYYWAPFILLGEWR